MFQAKSSQRPHQSLFLQSFQSSLNISTRDQIFFYQWMVYIFNNTIIVYTQELIFLIFEAMMMKKRPCKFNQDCRNFLAGKECGFSHDGGQSNSSFAPRKQFNNSSFGPRKQFSQPKSETLCRFGMRCNKLADGKCPFKHQEGMDHGKPQSKMPEPRQFAQPKNETPCQFGARCNMFPLGKCPFKHEQSFAPPSQPNHFAPQPKRQDTSQSFKNVLSSICPSFLMNRTQYEECGRLHQFTSSKNIKKIFQADNMKVVKCSIYQYYQQDEQPIYAILIQGRIVFGQLINLAKESGMEHINNSAMVLKRCYDRDIAFQDELIQDFYLMHTLSQDYPRMDVLVIKTTRNLHICLLNTGSIQSLPNNRNILSSIFIKTHVLIIFEDKSRLFFRLDPSSLRFNEDNIPIANNLYNFRGHHKKLYGSQIVGCISGDKSICFLNQRLETHIIDMEQKVKDLFILEHQGTPFSIVLTQKQLFIINLLTFHKKSILEGGIGQGLQFSSMIHTLNYLFLTIDYWGVLIYNLDTLQTPAGVLCLGQRQWKLASDDRGNLSMISHEKNGYSSWWVFKVRRH